MPAPAGILLGFCYSSKLSCRPPATGRTVDPKSSQQGIQKEEKLQEQEEEMVEEGEELLLKEVAPIDYLTLQPRPSARPKPSPR